LPLDAVIRVVGFEFSWAGWRLLGQQSIQGQSPSRLALGPPTTEAIELSCGRSWPTRAPRTTGHWGSSSTRFRVFFVNSACPPPVYVAMTTPRHRSSIPAPDSAPE